MTDPGRAAGPAAILDELAGLDLNTGFARAVVEGMVEGQVWTSRDAGVGAMHAVHPYGMSLVWGRRLDQAFDEVVQRLRDGGYRTRTEWLQVDPRWVHLPWAERLRPGVHVRVNYVFDPDLFASARAGFSIPQGWRIVRADASDFLREGSVVPGEFWRDADQFLAHGGGWRAERDGFRGALAFSSFRFDDELELGIETAPHVRGLGLGVAVAAQMIDDLLGAGLTPVWSCREGNVASCRLAARLGFREVRRMPYFELEAARNP